MDRNQWNCLVPESTKYAVDAIAGLIFALYELAMGLKGTQDVEDTVKVYYHYHATGSSLDPCGVYPMGTERIQCECPWEDFTLAEDHEVVREKAWHMAKAMIEQGKFFHPGHRILRGVGLEVNTSGGKLLLMRRCWWPGHKDSRTTWTG